MQFDIDAQLAWPLRHALARDLQGASWTMSLKLLPGSRVRLSLMLSSDSFNDALSEVGKLAPGAAVNYVCEVPDAPTNAWSELATSMGIRRGSGRRDGIPTVGRLLDIEHVLLEVDASNQSALFEHIASIAAQRYGIDAEAASTSLAYRESLGSTALGQGIAVPHGRIPGAPCELVFYVRLKTPIAFGAPDGRPVTDVVCLLLPDWANNIHLHLLASVAELFCDHRFRQRLQQCDNARAVVQLFRGDIPIEGITASEE